MQWEPACNNEDPVPPKINEQMKKINIYRNKKEKKKYMKSSWFCHMDYLIPPPFY